MVGNLFLDLRKGFDFVNHDLLLKKLAVYHFWQHSIDLFQSNLRNRKQLVHIDFFSVRLLSDLGVFSHPRNNGQWPPTSKDFYRRFYIYKWSATLYTSDISVSNLETILQKDLNHGLEWWYINKMNLNAPKTRCMLIGSSRKLSKSRDLHLTIGDYQIDCIKQYKLISVNLDTNLKWSFHVDNIHKKLTNKVLLLRRIKPYITLEMRKLYYNSYILPIIDYGIILWQYAPKRKLIKIANIQKRTARMILAKSWDQPSTQLFKELNWLPLQSRITYHVALLVF